MAVEWGCYGSRVNTVGPTFIRTPLTEPTFANPERVPGALDRGKNQARSRLFMPVESAHEKNSNESMAEPLGYRPSVPVIDWKSREFFSGRPGLKASFTNPRNFSGHIRRSEETAWLNSLLFDAGSCKPCSA